MTLEDESYSEELGYYNTTTTDGLIKDMSRSIVNNLIENLAYGTTGDRESISILLDEKASPSELIKRIELLIGDGFSFEAVANHVRERLKQEISRDNNIFDERIKDDLKMKKFTERVNREIEEWKRTGKVPPMSEEAREHMEKLVLNKILQDRENKERYL